MSFTMFDGEIIETYDLNSKIDEIDASKVKKIVMSDEVSENFCNVFKCINLETLIIYNQHIKEDPKKFYGSLKNIKTLLIDSEYASGIKDWVHICPNAEIIMNTYDSDEPINLDLCKNLKYLLINVSPKEMRDANKSRTLKYVGIPPNYCKEDDDQYEEQYDLTLEAIKKLNLEIEIDIDDLLDNGICVYDLT